MSLDLHEILKNSYADRNKQQKALKKYGYNYDSMLSNRDNQVYYNPKDNKLLHSISGTHNISDIGTDIYLGLGKLKDTDRYKDSHRILREAKNKYSVDNANIVAHSLGGSIAGYVSGKNDNVYTLDKGATIGQKVRNNEHAYRTSGDIVSVLNSNSKHMTTLENPNKSSGNIVNDIYQAHDIGNIKNHNIFV